jgi:hypothetical protein
VVHGDVDQDLLAPTWTDLTRMNPQASAMKEASFAVFSQRDVL